MPLNLSPSGAVVYLDIARVTGVIHREPGPIAKLRGVRVHVYRGRVEGGVDAVTVVLGAQPPALPRMRGRMRAVIINVPLIVVAGMAPVPLPALDVVVYHVGRREEGEGEVLG